MEDTKNTAEVATPSTSGMSLAGRLMNVYAAPGEVFEAIKTTRPAALNWLVPLLLACLVGVIHVWVMFSQPAVQQQMKVQQAAKFQEMVGLCTMISVLGGIITLLVIVAKGNMYMTLSPALLIGELDMQNKMHLVLSSLNIVTLWYVGVMSAGLSKLTGKSFVTTALWLYGTWLVLRAGMILSGLAASGM